MKQMHTWSFQCTGDNHSNYGIVFALKSPAVLDFFFTYDSPGSEDTGDRLIKAQKQSPITVELNFQISSSKHFCSFNFHSSMAVLFYIITKVNLGGAFNFHGFASAEIDVKCFTVICRSIVSRYEYT